jgi:aspartate/methionine/tyrosine aminotransferase
MNDSWKADATYMEWAKLESGARFNLAGSGLANLKLEELPATLKDFAITGDTGYGHAPLVEALSRHLGLATDCVVLAPGTSMANHLALAGLLEPGDEVLVESPTYPLISAVVRYLRATLTMLPRRAENGFRIDLESLRQRLTPRTRLLALTNLHNPSSALADEATLRELAALARETGFRVLVDEVYLDCVFDGTAASTATLGPEFVVTSSLTKVYGLSGLRCGWIVADAVLARQLWRLNDIFSSTFAHPAERLSVVALENLPSLRARAKRVLAANRELVDRFLDARDDLDCVRTRWGTTAFPRLRSGGADALCQRLRRTHETSVVPGRFFGAPDHFRIGLGGDSEVLREGLARISAALDEEAR